MDRLFGESCRQVDLVRLELDRDERLLYSVIHRSIDDALRARNGSGPGVR
jgi:hypothetical protein